MSELLKPAKVAGLDLKNRVVMSPMCMYEVAKEDGIATDFHFAHYGARALGGVSLIITESTAVLPDGRITKNDLGLWNDQQAEKFSQLVSYLHGLGTKVGVQLNHAGRKAEDAKLKWAPSAIAYNEIYGQPKEMSLAEIAEVKEAFVAAAKRAQAAGVDVIEIHGAHGYLLNQFLSPKTNQRNDEYGGTLAKRYRLVDEIVRAVRAEFTGSLWLRISATDYAPEAENTMADWKQVAGWLQAAGLDCLDVSTGGLLDVKPNIPLYDGYQVQFASALKAASDLSVAAVGLLDNPGLCEYLVQTKQVDLILQARALLRNPNWVMKAATALHDHDYQAYNASYERARL
ncbi:NADPH dehydrogenase [Ligilactobacillus agilis]|uniref:oxidoreductase n=1 Tax=Ligilactobacillus agilis TaxID=1601 RepID=UPI000B8DA6E3|nr:NADPH dehydrogenase [Ligilactobacillus agilis]ASR41899.1 NADPH dehydrogenase [Ligilactobacillus agilis]